jgi:hypothetical protein
MGKYIYLFIAHAQADIFLRISSDDYLPTNLAAGDY